MKEPQVESKRSSPRIKVQIQAKKGKAKQSDSEEDSVESKKTGLLIPILANQKKDQKKSPTAYALFCNEFKTLVKTEYKNSKSNLIEGQKGAPTQK
jgi:hypothetical protein